MKEKWKIAVAFLVLGVFIVAGNLRVSATESEDLFLKDILDDTKDRPLVLLQQAMSKMPCREK